MLDKIIGSILASVAATGSVVMLCGGCMAAFGPEGRGLAFSIPAFGLSLCSAFLAFVSIRMGFYDDDIDPEAVQQLADSISNLSTISSD